jgi:diguanylate cyclase (GGDEF)-like protein
MSIGILFEDNRKRVEYLNPAFLRMWAIDETLDLVGHPMREILEHSTHRFARPDHASRYVLQILDTHELDDFKAINDTFGHRAGDMALVRTAGEVTTQVRATEMFARLGGDEFAILSTLGVGHEPGTLPARIVNTISAIPFRFRGTNLRLTASVGIALFPEHGENVEDLVAHADSAMYQAKNQGKNSWALYDPSRDTTEAIVRRLN